MIILPSPRDTLLALYMQWPCVCP